MSVFIVSSSNSPEITNLLMGSYTTISGEQKEMFFDINTISLESKQVYDTFFDMMGLNVSVEIINSPYFLDCNHVTPQEVALEAIVIDYATLDEDGKKKIDDAFAILETFLNQ